MRRLLALLLALMLPAAALGESALHAPQADPSYGTVMTCENFALPFAAFLTGAPMLLLDALEDDEQLVAFPSASEEGALRGRIHGYTGTQREAEQFPIGRITQRTPLLSPDRSRVLATLDAGDTAHVVGRTMDRYLVATAGGVYGSVPLAALQTDDTTVAYLRALLPNAAADGDELRQWEEQLTQLERDVLLLFDGCADLMPQETQIALSDLMWRVGRTEERSYAVSVPGGAMTSDEAFACVSAFLNDAIPELLDGVVGYSYRLDRADFTQRWHIYLHSGENGSLEILVDEDGRVTIVREGDAPLDPLRAALIARKGAEEALHLTQDAHCVVSLVHEAGDAFPQGYYWISLYAQDGTVAVVTVRADTGEIGLCEMLDEDDENG